jgi:hypothetical protein
MLISINWTANREMTAYSLEQISSYLEMAWWEENKTTTLGKQHKEILTVYLPIQYENKSCANFSMIELVQGYVIRFYIDDKGLDEDGYQVLDAYVKILKFTNGNEEQIAEYHPRERSWIAELASDFYDSFCYLLTFVNDSEEFKSFMNQYYEKQKDYTPIELTKNEPEVLSAGIKENNKRFQTKHSN